MVKGKTLTVPASPQAWANRLTRVLDTVLGGNRFPVNVSDVALEYSRQCYPDDPIVRVHGEPLPGFDGALLRTSTAKTGWTIIHNNGFVSKGRINFTLAHELGHYLVHRARFPNGFRCTQEDVVRWETDYKATELEANTFAAYLLMPLHDFRRQVPDDSEVTWDVLSSCADRYGVSLISATLRWLEYTQRRAILIVSRDGFVLWAKPSKPALRTGIFLRTKTTAVEVPAGSLAANQSLSAGRTDTIAHLGNTWFAENLTETVIRSDAYDFTMSLLQLGAPDLRAAVDDEETDELRPDADFARNPFGRKR